MQDLGRQIDIIRGAEFKSANRALNGMIKERKRENIPKSKQGIEPDDLKKILSFFQREAQTSPVALRLCVWYHLVFHFVGCGVEFFHELKRDSLIFNTDEKGEEYVTLSPEFIRENLPGMKKGYGTDRRMYATGKPDCPVKMLRFFIQQTDDDAERLFNGCSLDALADPTPYRKWYSCKRFAKRSFGEFMPDLSKIAYLSQRYTSCALKVTATQAIYDAGKYMYIKSPARKQGGGVISGTAAQPMCDVG